MTRSRIVVGVWTTSGRQRSAEVVVRDYSLRVCGDGRDDQHGANLWTSEGQGLRVS
jgi:hypothetical protein